MIKPELNEQDSAVVEYLTTIGVVFNAVYVGETKREEWPCDAWRVSFTSRAASGGLIGKIDQDYFTGLGHRKAVKGAGVAPINPRSIAYESWVKQYVKPVMPTAAAVLYSLIIDTQTAGQNFFDWCADSGYDSDSRKAFNVYEQCCAIRQDMHKVFTREQLAQLAILTEEY